MTARSFVDRSVPAMPADAVWVSGIGLWIGRRLVDPCEDHDEVSHSRLELTLAFAFGQPLAPGVVKAIKAAQALARTGDLATANIRLALARPGRIPALSDLDRRLSLAKRCLDAGMPPDELPTMADARSTLARTYDASEPRVPPHSGDHGGEWTRAGDHTSTAADATDHDASSSVLPAGHVNDRDEAGGDAVDVQYRGFYHDSFIEDMLKQLSDYGSTTLANIPLIGLAGITAIADGASLPEADKRPYFIDAKTGLNPSFTTNQRHVYDLLCIGGHVISLDERVRRLGLLPGVPLPPMDIMIMRTLGPGQTIYFDSYCEKYSSWARPHVP